LCLVGPALGLNIPLSLFVKLQSNLIRPVTMRDAR
jgi:hypothetical protein